MTLISRYPPIYNFIRWPATAQYNRNKSPVINFCCTYKAITCFPRKSCFHSNCILLISRNLFPLVIVPLLLPFCSLYENFCCTYLNDFFRFKGFSCYKRKFICCCAVYSALIFPVKSVRSYKYVSESPSFTA